MTMITVIKFDNRFKLKYIKISAIKFGTKQRTNANCAHSALYTAFPYHAMFGPFVLFACC